MSPSCAKIGRFVQMAVIIYRKINSGWVNAFLQRSGQIRCKHIIISIFEKENWEG